MPADPKRIDHALALADGGRPAEADTLLAHLATQHRDPLAAWHLAWLRLRGGDGDGALACLRDFADDPLCNDRLREQLLGERRNADAAAILRAAPLPPGQARERVVAAIEHHLRGDFAAAATAAREALAIAPANAPAHNHLARALHNLGQAAAAQQEFERAVHADPRYPEAWHNLGHVLRARGQADDALAAFEHALRIAPGYRSARLNLGITLYSLDRPDAALACFEALLERRRDDVEAMVNAGLCMQLSGDLRKARQRYERALELAPGLASAWFYLGVLLAELGEPAAAGQALQKALAIDPADAEAWAELASLHAAGGAREPARNAVQHGLRLAPAHPQLNIEAARLERDGGDLLGAEARLRRLDPARLPPRVRQRYFYELGNVLDRNQQNDAAYRAFEQANTLAAQGVRRRGDDGEAFFRELDAIASWVDAGAPGIDAGAADADGDRGADLCFLVGFPRSGMAQLASRLQAHPGISLVQDAPTLEPVIAMLQGLPGGYPESLARLDAADRIALRRMLRLALQRHGAVAGRRIVDARPLRGVHAGVVQALFPEARLLCTQRHPGDVVLANFMEPYAAGGAFASFHTVAGGARLYDAVQSLWQRLQPRLSLRVGEVRHEVLVDTPDAAFAAVFDFLGVDPAVAPPTDAPARPARRLPPRWSRYRDALAPVRPRLAPHAARLDYPLD